MVEHARHRGRLVQQDRQERRRRKTHKQLEKEDAWFRRQKMTVPEVQERLNEEVRRNQQAEEEARNAGNSPPFPGR